MRGSSENRVLAKMDSCGKHLARGLAVQVSRLRGSRRANYALSLARRRGWPGCISLNKRNEERNSSLLNLRSDPHPVHRRLTAASLSLLTPRTKSPSACTRQPSTQPIFSYLRGGSVSPHEGLLENGLLNLYAQPYKTCLSGFRKRLPQYENYF